MKKRKPLGFALIPCIRERRIAVVFEMKQDLRSGHYANFFFKHIREMSDLACLHRAVEGTVDDISYFFIPFSKA